MEVSYEMDISHAGSARPYVKFNGQGHIVGHNSSRSQIENIFRSGYGNAL